MLSTAHYPTADRDIQWSTKCVYATENRPHKCTDICFRLNRFLQEITETFNYIVIKEVCFQGNTISYGVQDKFNTKPIKNNT